MGCNREIVRAAWGSFFEGATHAALTLSLLSPTSETFA